MVLKRRQVGPYRVIERLGSGSYGAVYRAVLDPRSGTSVPPPPPPPRSVPLPPPGKPRSVPPPPPPAARRSVPPPIPGAREVALKVLYLPKEKHSVAARFARESSYRIQHPNVVRVLDSGTVGDEAYIAMELLEGRTLEQVLREVRERGEQWSPAQVRELGLQLGRALAAIHAQGLVHRDVKPANVFCCDDGTFKLLDLGMARSTADDATALTRAGAVVGTPAYMSPEQARSEDIDGRSDLFSLGAILYFALTAHRVFSRGNPVETIMAVVLEPCDPVRQHRPDAPPALAAVIERCLEKSPNARFANADDLSAALRALDPVALQPTTSAGSAGAMARPEMRVVAALVADEVSAPKRLAAAVQAQGGELIALRGGNAVGVFGGATTQGDELRRAVTAALDARSAARWMAVDMVRALAGEKTVLAGSLAPALAHLEAHMAGVCAPAELEARLAGFAVRRRDTRVEIVGTRDEEIRAPEDVGPPMIGRDRELGLLEQRVSEAMDAQESRTVVVVGAPGLGKTRLRVELAARLRDHESAPLVVGLTLDSRRREAFGVAGQVLRRALLADATNEAERHARLDGFLARAPQDLQPSLRRALGLEAPAELPATITQVLGPQQRRDQVRLELLDALSSLVQLRATAVLLDDAQWADRESLDLLEALVLRMRRRALLVVAFGRPGDRLRGCWERSSATRVALRPLSEAEVGALARAVSGRKLDPAQRRALFARSEGNPMFVTYLAAQAGESLPLDVEAVLQARLDRLDAAQKETAKVAAVLGGAFRVADLERLGAEDASDHADELVRRGVFRREGRALTFQSPLVQQVAYRMVPGARARALHAKLAEMMSEAGASPARIAHHLERADRLTEAARVHTEAALLAAQQHDGAQVLFHAERALALEPDPDARFGLLLARARALVDHGGFRQRHETLEAAMEAARSDHERAQIWVERVHLLASTGEYDAAVLAGAQGAQFVRRQDDPALKVLIRVRLAHAHLYAGRYEDAGMHLALAEAEVGAAPELAGLVASWQGQYLGMTGDLGGRMQKCEEALALHERAGNQRGRAQALGNLADAHNRVGAYEEAATRLRECIEIGRRVGNVVAEGYAQCNLGYALGQLGDTEGARGALAEAIEIASRLDERRMLAAARVYRARVLLAGDAVAAASEAVGAAELCERAEMPSIQALAHMHEARAWLAVGDAEGALGAIERAVAIREELGGLEEDEAETWLAHAEVLDALGRPDDASEIARAGVRRLHELAWRIEDDDWRRRFLKDVPAHRALLDRGAR